MTDTKVDREYNAAPWPFGAHKARSELSVPLIDAHAVDIVGRALSTRRLMVFAGAGLTMGYGRMTWSQLLDAAYEQMPKAAQTNGTSSEGPHATTDPDAAAKRAVWDDVANRLWSRDSKTFQKNKGHYVIAAQLFHHAWPAKETGRQPTSALLHVFVARQLKNHVGRLVQLLPELAELAKTWENSPDSEHFKVLRTSQTRRLTLDQFILPYVAGTTPASDLADLYQKVFLPLIANGPSADGKSLHQSPLDILINDYGVRRFLTTNYDREIEQALEVFDYPLRQERVTRDIAGHGTWHRSLELDDASTGQAICFAVDGARRHAEVLHIHGTCEEPEKLIITESDYQRLYLEEHNTRDLLENAARANFGANPLLFVGSNVEEDDIMRPLRQFMTGAPHRRDRMAVALLPALKGDAEAAMQKLTLYLRFGVHALHYGYVEESGFDPQSALRTNALREIDAICVSVMSLCEKLENGANFRLPRMEDALEQDEYADADGGICFRESARPGRPIVRVAKDAITIADNAAVGPPKAGLTHWKRPAVADGTPEGRIELREECLGLLQCMLAATNRLLQITQLVESDTRREAARRVRLSMEELRSAFTTLFMCAALKSLRAGANRRLRDERTLASPRAAPYLQDIADYNRGERGLRPFKRHAVALYRRDYASWFAIPKTKYRDWQLRESDEALQQLCARVRMAQKFRGQFGRRALVVSAPRGAGKGALFDSFNNGRRLRMLCRALGGYELAYSLDDKSNGTLFFHLNLTFCDDIGPVMAQVSETIVNTCAPDVVKEFRNATSAGQDQIEWMAVALEALMQPERRARCLLMLGNAGVLFDEHGEAKNGQVRRFLQLLISRSYRTARIDVVLFCSEMNLPAVLRGVATRGSDVVAELPENWDTAMDYPDVPVLRPAQIDLEAFRSASKARIAARRLRFLNLLPDRDSFPAVLLMGLRPIKASKLWRRFFRRLGKTRVDVADDAQKADDVLKEVYRATGANRMAMTLIFAFVRLGETSRIYDMLQEFVRELRLCAPESAVDHVTALVMDRWFQRHLHQEEVLLSKPRVDGTAKRRLSLQSWNLVTEVLWTLSVLSQPVDASVLLGSKAVLDAVGELAEGQPADECGKTARSDSEAVDCEGLLNETLESLVFWCLAFRFEPRPGTDGTRHRYSLHRHVQRHFWRLSGGRNIETTQWDQFTTTLYASQPDELPAVTHATHVKLVNLVKDLSEFPRKYVAPRTALVGGELEVARDRLRAAYSLVRSSFSMGILARSVDVNARGDGCGAMEEYRRLVRWITLRARRLEDPASQVPVRQDQGVFYAGELLWLYNECGVIALAQGKLDQAEEFLTMAELAAHRVENDNTGSMHVRVRLHTALTQIERGRPALARSILLPISERRGDHPVPTSLAKFYLGLIEHIGGNYGMAEQLYGAAAKELSQAGRSRALAFVLQASAELHYLLHAEQAMQAISMADKAISLAQRGGHEDIRVIATLTRARVKIDANQFDGLFDQLDFAQRYSNRMDMPRIACAVHEVRARLLYRQGETVMSAREASGSLEIAALYDLKLMKARAMLTLAKIYAERGDIEGARALTEAGKELASSAEYFYCVREFGELDLKLSPRAAQKKHASTAAAGGRNA